MQIDENKSAVLAKVDDAGALAQLADEHGVADDDWTKLKSLVDSRFITGGKSPGDILQTTFNVPNWIRPYVQWAKWWDDWTGDKDVYEGDNGHFYVFKQ